MGESNPAMWISPADLPILDGTVSKQKFVEVVRGMQQKAQGICDFGWKYHELWSDVIRKEDLTTDLCAWALSTAKSRCWAVDYSGTSRICLVPYLDLFNHDD